MIGGILIGIGIAAFIFLVVWILKKGNKPSIFTYLAIAVAAVVLSIEGTLMLKAIDAKQNIGRTMSLVQNTIMEYLPEQGQNYRITSGQASTIMIALSVALPSVSSAFDAEDLADKTVVEITDSIRLAVEQSTAQLVRKSIWLLVITSIVMAVLTYALYSFGGSLSFIGSGMASSSGLSGTSSDDF